MEYKLFIEINGLSIPIKSGSLLEIDKFTTFFKNKDILIKSLKLNLENCNLYIKSDKSRKKNYSFIGSDFSNLTNIYTNNYIEFLNNIILNNEFFLLNYFKNKMKQQTIFSKNNNDIFKQEFFNDEIYLKIINTLDKKIRKVIDNIPIDIMFEIRKYCRKYDNFREIFCYYVGMGLFFDNKKDFNEQEKKQIYNEINRISNNIEKIFLNDNKPINYDINFNLDYINIDEKSR